MSKQAEAINRAHKQYAAAVGTPREREAYERLQAVVAGTRRRPSGGSTRSRAKARSVTR